VVRIYTQSDGPRLYEVGPSDLYKVPSVTEVLRVISKSYLDAWKHRVGSKEASRVLGNAQSFGNRVHAAIQDIATGKKIVVAKDIEPHVEAAKRFIDLHVEEVVHSELRLANLKLGFGGTLDLYCKFTDGSYGIVDWKTSRQLTRTVGHQLAAYALLLREEGYAVNRRVGVRLKKEKPGEFQAKSYSDHEGDVRVFRSCVNLWWACNAQKKDGLKEWVPEDAADVEDVA
jgi:hypothetical protein